MSLSSQELEAIVARVVSRLSNEIAQPPGREPARPPLGQVGDRRGSELRYGSPVADPVRTADVKGQYQPAPAYLRGRKGVFDDLDSAVSAARTAFEELNWKVDLATRDRMIQAMRDVH